MMTARLVIALALLAPVAGLVLAVATGNATWLWLCLPLVLFLS